MAKGKIPVVALLAAGGAALAFFVLRKPAGAAGAVSLGGSFSITPASLSQGPSSRAIVFGANSVASANLTFTGTAANSGNVAFNGSVRLVALVNGALLRELIVPVSVGPGQSVPVSVTVAVSAGDVPGTVTAAADLQDAVGTVLQSRVTPAALAQIEAVSQIDLTGGFGIS